MTDIKKKGLGPLISSNIINIINRAPQNKSEKETQKVALISDLNRNRYQPRLKFDENKINELASMGWELAFVTGGVESR